MASTPTDISSYTSILADALGDRSRGQCAVASVVLWRLWMSLAHEELVLCIAFNDNVAYHVFLRQHHTLLDPTSHQFEEHAIHSYDGRDKAKRQHYHQHTVETTCMRDFHNVLREVDWPIEQWPTPEKVMRMTQTLLERAQASAHCVRAPS